MDHGDCDKEFSGKILQTYRYDKLMAKLSKTGTGRNELRDVKKACILNTKCDVICDTNSIDLDCLKYSINFISVQINDAINLLLPLSRLQAVRGVV